MERAIFEASIYNADVRKQVAEGLHHRDLSDEWADCHLIETEAHNAQEARNRLAKRYPSDRGFVIEAIIRLD